MRRLRRLARDADGMEQEIQENVKGRYQEY